VQVHGLVGLIDQGGRPLSPDGLTGEFRIGVQRVGGVGSLPRVTPERFR
jgi:hypothetical protein